MYTGNEHSVALWTHEQAMQYATTHDLLRFRTSAWTFLVDVLGKSVDDAMKAVKYGYLEPSAVTVARRVGQPPKKRRKKDVKLNQYGLPVGQAMNHRGVRWFVSEHPTADGDDRATSAKVKDMTMIIDPTSPDPNAFTRRSYLDLHGSHFVEHGSVNRIPNDILTTKKLRPLSIEQNREVMKKMFQMRHTKTHKGEMTIKLQISRNSTVPVMLSLHFARGVFTVEASSCGGKKGARAGVRHIGHDIASSSFGKYGRISIKIIHNDPLHWLLNMSRIDRTMLLDVMSTKFAFVEEPTRKLLRFALFEVQLYKLSYAMSVKGLLKIMYVWQNL